MTGQRWVAAAATLAALAAGGIAALRTGEPDRTLVAHFTAAVGVHPGSDVRILGVRVGEVTLVVPQGRTVRVEMSYHPRYELPAEVTALIVPPSVVSDRHVQLTPTYAGGPVLPDGAELAPERTAAPIELAEIYRAVDELTRALGPDGANADGALSRLVATGRANLDGNGELLNDTLDGLSRTLSTLAEGRDDLFGTVTNLQRFTTTLAGSEEQVRAFNDQLAQVAEHLAAESDDLTEALRLLAAALADITAFIHDNREELVANVEALTDVTGVLVRQQQALIEVLDVAPLALSNLALSYNPASGTLDTRDNLTGPHQLAGYLCSVLADALPESQVPAECFQLADLLPELPPGAGAAEQERDLTLGGVLRGGS